jgi:hypothetical protein
MLDSTSLRSFFPLPEKIDSRSTTLRSFFPPEKIDARSTTLRSFFPPEKIDSSNDFFLQKKIEIFFLISSYLTFPVRQQRR